MCFSATASFTAAGALAILGGVSIAKTQRRAMLPFAAIPLLFAAQQASEGFVWRILDHADWSRSSTWVSEVFLFFALLLWPFWIGFSCWSMEPDARRKRPLAAFAIAGLALGGYLYACAAFRPVYACIAQQHIYYGVEIETSVRHALNVPYVAIVVGALVTSSVRGTSIFGVALAIAAGIAIALYRVGFASVWCFLSAILSVIVVAIVIGDRERERASSTETRGVLVPRIG